MLSVGCGEAVCRVCRGCVEGVRRLSLVWWQRGPRC